MYQQHTQDTSKHTHESLNKQHQKLDKPLTANKLLNFGAPLRIKAKPNIQYNSEDTSSDDNIFNTPLQYKPVSNYEKKKDFNGKQHNNKIYKTDMTSINIDFDDMFSSPSAINTIVSANGKQTHLWNSMKIPDFTVKSMNGAIKINGLEKFENVSGTVNILNIDSGIAYFGMIYLEKSNLTLKFVKPMIPLFVKFNAVLQFNLFIQ